MTVAELRRWAIHQSFPSPTSLGEAIHNIGFIQADPIRSPARAQDLILRHRVHNYRAGDLEAHYQSLDVEEDFLYCYGFASRGLWQLLHPKPRQPLTALQKQVLNLVEHLGEAHPSHLEPHLGSKRTLNAWGGYSKASTRALEALHHQGLLRVARRDKGIRVYAPAKTTNEPTNPERHQRLALAIVNLFLPVPERSLSQILRLVQSYARVPIKQLRQALDTLLKKGELTRCESEGISYLLPATLLDAPHPPPTVKILAPFDPLVWDRLRFEHLWGWPYRFEAYTPPAKRTMGYYAMPLLWNDAVIGWVNATIKEGNLIAEPGFRTGKAPRTKAFTTSLNRELEDLATSLHATL